MESGKKAFEIGLGKQRGTSVVKCELRNTMCDGNNRVPGGADGTRGVMIDMINSLCGAGGTRGAVR